MLALRNCILVLLLVSASSLAQTPRQKNPAYDLWLVRSQRITTELLEDASDLDASNRAILFARLAERWWQDNPAKSRAWMISAIETVENVPNKETKDEHQKRFDTARQLLNIVTPLDKKLSQRLVKILSDDVKDASDLERNTARWPRLATRG